MLSPSDATVSRPRVRAAAEQAGGPAGGGRQGGAEAAGQADNLSDRGQDNILDFFMPQAVIIDNVSPGDWVH